MIDVLVLGAGVAGLTAARALAKTGLSVAGPATQRIPIADRVEAAYASGLRAAGEARAHLALPLAPALSDRIPSARPTA